MSKQATTLNTKQPVVTIPVPTRRKPLKLSEYRELKIWTGDRIGGSSRFLEALYPDQFQNWNESELTRYIRVKYGNEKLHVRLMGGPKKNDYWIPPRQLWAENNGEKGVAVEGIRQLEIELQLLREQNEQLRIQLELQGRNPSETSSVAHEFNIDSFLESVREEEPEEKSSLDRLADLAEKILSPVVSALAPIGGAFAAKKMCDMVGLDEQVTRNVVLEVLTTSKTIQSEQMQTNNHQNRSNSLNDQQARPGNPRPYAIDDDDFDIPKPLMEYLDGVDWTKTNWQKLLEALSHASGLLGIKMKEGEEVKL